MHHRRSPPRAWRSWLVMWPKLRTSTMWAAARAPSYLTCRSADPSRRPAGGSVRAVGPFRLLREPRQCMAGMRAGWHVEEGDTTGTGLRPQMLISLTAPKLAARFFEVRACVPPCCTAHHVPENSDGSLLEMFRGSLKIGWFKSYCVYQAGPDDRTLHDQPLTADMCPAGAPPAAEMPVVM